MKVRIWVETNNFGSRCETVVDFPDDMTDEELEHYAFDDAMQMADWGFERVEEA